MSSLIRPLTRLGCNGEKIERSMYFTCPLYRCDRHGQRRFAGMILSVMDPPIAYYYREPDGLIKLNGALCPSACLPLLMFTSV